MSAERAERVTYDLADGVASVRMVRADKHNGLDWAMFEALGATIDELAAMGDELRCVVLAGEGPSFCAGLDFKSFTSGDEEIGDMFSRREGEDANFAQRVAYGWRSLPVPVIAALHGACYGGGCQIALAADIRIAAPDTKLSVMEIRYGLIPDMSISQTLPRLVGDDVARELTYTARVVEADEALTMGLLTRIDDAPVERATELAAEIASKPAAAVRSAKRLFTEAPALDAAEGLALEERLQRELLAAAEKLGAAAG